MLLQFEEDIQTLKSLGLTLSQAKVYIVATKHGQAKAKDLWKDSGVGRQELYRILAELLAAGLIEKEISNPTRFRAQPLSKGAILLLNRKRQEIDQLSKEVKKISSRKKTSCIHEKESQFCILKRKYLMESRGKISYKNAKRQIDFLASSERMLGAFGANLSVYDEAVRRGVFMRVLTEKLNAKQVERLKKVANPLLAKPNFTVTTTTQTIKATISIIDCKEAYFTLGSQKAIYEDELLWTNNSTMVLLAKSYFDANWTSAKPVT